MVGSEISLLNKADWTDFRDAIFSDTNKADLIVAIARKMPRLLEYLGYVEQSTSPVITERALPWISNAELSRIHVRYCDDILNVGSTIWHYVDYALRRGLKQESVVVYARREQHRRRCEQKQLAKHNLKVLESFDEQSYWRFETMLPQILLTMGKPYDLDFPVISLRISHLDASRTTDKWFALLRRLYHSVNNLTTPLQREAGVASFSLNEPLETSLESLVGHYENKFPPILKVRIYIHARTREIRIVPMCIPVVRSEALEKGDLIVDAELNSLYMGLAQRFNEGSPFPLEPLYNLFVYLISYEYGRLFLNKFRQLLEHINDQKVDLSARDLCFIFGQEIALELKDFLEERLLQAAVEVPVRETPPVESYFEKPLNPDLVNEVTEKLRERKFHGSPVTELVREALRILDEIAEANDPMDPLSFEYLRLRKGFALCDLWWIAQKMCADGVKPSFSKMSFLLDYYIDLGVIVPVVSLINKSYCRVYRRGEADPIEYSRFVHQLLMDHDKVYPDSPLVTTTFTKILAAQAIYHKGLVPLDPVFDFMGTVSYWHDPKVVEEHTLTALDFLYNIGAIRYEEPDKKKEPSLFD